MISGHWAPRWVDSGYLDMLLTEGHRLAELHHDLLPLDQVELGRFGLGTRITPYRSRIRPRRSTVYSVLVRNPLPRAEQVTLELVVPYQWSVEEPRRTLHLGPGQEATVTYAVQPPDDRNARNARNARVDRARIGVDLTAGEVRFGQVAEALVDVW